VKDLSRHDVYVFNVAPDFRRGESGELVPHEAEQAAIREIVSLRAQGKALRVIAQAVAAKGLKLSHEGVAGVLRAAGYSGVQE
jgi:hypothetical protein